MLRFDPTKPDHAKYEKKIEPKIKKKVPDILPEKEPKIVYDKDDDKMKNVVSKEKFYKVAESLKETLQKQNEGNEFSLRKLFGASDGGLSRCFIHSYIQTYFVFNLSEFSWLL